MVSYPATTSVKFNTFKGIRTRNGIANNGVISATVCKNVDFVPSSYDAGVIIQTSLGNYKYCDYETLYGYTYVDTSKVKHTIYTKTTVLGASTVLYTATETVNTDNNWAVVSTDDGYEIQYDGHKADYVYKDNTSVWEVVKGFEFETEHGTLKMFYIEDTRATKGTANKGKLLKYYGGTFTELSTYTYFDDEDTEHNTPLTGTVTFTKTGEANAITMLDSAYNTFVITNGIEYYAYCPDNTDTNVRMRKLNPQYDVTGDGNLENITGLAMCEQDGSLVIGCNEGVVLASAKGDITDFNYNAAASLTKAWYQIFGKPVTAVVPYIDALLVFTEEDSTMLTGNLSSGLDGGADRKDASLGGCMSFESWAKHDKYLFFYDNNQKNVYYYTQNDYGQKVLGQPIAPEVQKYFNDVTRLQMISYIGNNRSEIWLLSDDFKLIYDYYIGEWSERDCQDLTSYFVCENNVFSTGSNKCFKEKAGDMCLFDEEYIPAEYTTQIINLGSFSNLKEMEYQPLVSVTSNYNNTFYIDCQIDGKKVKSKYVEMFYNGAVWADDSEQDESTPENELWAEDDENGIGQVFPDENDAVIQQVKGKFISNWYYLQFTFRTAKQGDDFSITCLELKGITEETDTVGRK